MEAGDTYDGANSAPSAPDKKRILVVDDDPELSDLLAESLATFGNYETFVARDGATALEMFIEQQPDCVVVDVRMPGLSGYQFVRAVRGDPATMDIPVIIISALVRPHEQLAGLLSGADAYLVKPVKLDDLLAAVERAMRVTPAQRRQQLQHFSDETNAK